jgi:hypothetical protein
MTDKPRIGSGTYGLGEQLAIFSDLGEFTELGEAFSR